jgi:hypothetical protein
MERCENGYKGASKHSLILLFSWESNDNLIEGVSKIHSRMKTKG